MTTVLPSGEPIHRPTARTTAAALLDAVRPCGVAVEGDELAYAPGLPVNLAAVVRVLHAGLRALLTGRKWFGCGSTPKTAAPVVLNPAFPIPPWVTLLAVEGDRSWDRIGPTVRSELPQLFDPAPGPSERG